MRNSWLPPQWRGRQRIAHPVNWTRLPEYDVGIALVQTRADHGHENRWYLYVRRFNEADVRAFPVLASTIITSSPGTTQTITSDATWDNFSNTVEVIGAGARGARGASTSTSGGGGGGGAYTKITNASITTPGTTQYFARVGGTTATDGSAGGDSWWTLSSPGTSYPSLGQTAVGAKGGAALASATSATGGAGGPQNSSYPSGGGETRSSGGNGGNAGASATSGGGGGGAGGVSPGLNGGTGPGAGGAGNSNAGGGGTGGAAGSPGIPGNQGINIQASPNVGSGGGGGGGNASPSTGGVGGTYGGGGGGGGRSTGVGGQGAQGVVVLTWTPASASGTLAVTEALDVAALPGGTVAWYPWLAAREGNLYELLLHFDGADGSTTITDSSGNNKTATARGGAEIDAGQPVFSAQALMLPNDGDYLSLDLSSQILGNGDFAIDFRARLSSGSAAQTFYDGGPGNFVISYNGSALKFVSAAGTITGGSLASNTNYHLAVTRGAGSTRLFRDGVQQGSTLTDATFYTGSVGYPVVGTAAAAVTGSLSATEASDVTAFTGTAAAGYDAATTAWIAAVGSGNVDANHAGYVDTLIVGLKADGTWTKFDRIWLFAAQNTNSAYCDLKVPTTAAFAVGSPTFTADRGFTLSPSGYVRLPFNIVTDASTFTQDTAHFSIWNLTSGADSNPVFNGVSAVGALHIYPEFSGGDCYCRVNEASTGPFTISGATGHIIGNRSDASTVQCYKNGTSLGSKSVASAARVSEQINIYNRQIAAFSIGGTLTSTEATSFYNRLRTYMSSVGVP
jgi:Concanavalin A-like lectin/glucanases superfamily